MILEMNSLTEKIIGCAIEVHKYLGPGLLESVYEECLCVELKLQGLAIERQVPVDIVYENVKVECAYNIDILVEDSVVLEVKSIDEITPFDSTQILAHMKHANKRIGLILNFNVLKLKDGIKRYIK